MLQSLSDTKKSQSPATTIASTPSHTAVVTPPSPTFIISGAPGTSLSLAGIIGIISTIAFLIGFVAWFAYYAIVKLPHGKARKMGVEVYTGKPRCKRNRRQDAEVFVV